MSANKAKYIPPHRRQANVRAEASLFSTPQKPQAMDDDDNAKDESHRVLLQLAITKAYCINLSSRTDKWMDFKKQARAVSSSFLESIERFDAIDGSHVEHDTDDVQLKWDSTINAKYSPKEKACIRTMLPGEVGCALSHIALWRKLVASDHGYFLILEDDCSFSKTRNGRDRFAICFARAWKELPSDWGLFYLGFSDRGERKNVNQCRPVSSSRPADEMDPQVQVFAPEYGYHTHAYMITKAAAQTMLENLPVSGPIDVWMADHQWFGVKAYSAVIANEGWKRDDGTYEGKTLVYQHRPKNFLSDVSPGK